MAHNVRQYNVEMIVSQHLSLLKSPYKNCSLSVATGERRQNAPYRILQTRKNVFKKFDSNLKI